MSIAEQTGSTTPTEHGFRITVYRPRRMTPPQFYAGLMILLGLRHTAPAPHEVEQLQVESTGDVVHLELLLVDGRLAVVDVPLDRGIKGLL